MNILLGSDHAGFALRRVLANWLIEQGYAVAEMGASDESAFDYPDAALELTTRLLRGDSPFGVLICGTGVGMAIAANRFKGIRAAPCWGVEVTRLAREHNHANVLCLGARLIDPDASIAILQTFLNTKESDEPRHARRVAKLDTLGDCEPLKEPAAKS